MTVAAAKDDKVTPGTEVADEVVEQVQQAPPPAAPKPAAKAATDAAPPATDSGVKKARLAKDDDEIPDDADLLELSRAALEKRLARHTRNELKTHFGTDDPAAIKKKLDKLAKHEADEEERQRAEMSERDRLTADVARERKLREQAQLRALRVQEERVVEQEEVRLTRIAEEHLDPDYVEVYLPKLARWLSTEFTGAQLKELGEDKARYGKTIGKWFKDQVARKPKIGKEAPVVKEALSNGASDDARPRAGNHADMLDGKTFAPGRPNSMTSGEAKAAAAKLGYRW
jgi:hypothetical protein